MPLVLKTIESAFSRSIVLIDAQEPHSRAFSKPKGCSRRVDWTAAAAMASIGGLLLAVAYRRLNIGVLRESVYMTAQSGEPSNSTVPAA